MHPFSRASGFFNQPRLPGAGPQMSFEDAILLGADPAAFAAVPAGLAATAVGIGDLFMGEQNGLNSGEIPLNYLASSVPVMGGLVGGAIGAGGAYLSSPAVQASDRTLTLVPDNKGNYSAPQIEAKRSVGPRKIGRKAAIGGAIGSAVAAIPAIGYMINDQPRQGESLAKSLSNEDKQVLNALLANQGISI